MKKDEISRNNDKVKEKTKLEEKITKPKIRRKFIIYKEVKYYEDFLRKAKIV